MSKKFVRNLFIGLMVFIIISVAIILVCIKTNFISGQSTISWQKNKEKDIVGYKIYYGTSPRKGDTPKDSAYTDIVDTKLENSYKLEKLSLFKTYYFSTTAYNKAGKESGLSEEVSKKIGIKDIFKK